MIGFILDIPLKQSCWKIKDLFRKEPGECHFFTDTNIELMIWGDAFNVEDLIRKGAGSVPDVSHLLTHLSGHFYFIILYKSNNEICIGNSMFSILPIYYLLKGDHLLLSENAFRLSIYSGQKSFSRRFILETALFNYPLFNNSVIDGIMLIPSNSYFSLKSGKLSLLKHTCIEDYFASSPVSWKKSAGSLTDLFLESTSKYLSGESYMSSITGGLDSRTLTAASMYFKRDVSCYCFGSSSSSDMEIARHLTNVAGIPFTSINLGNEYAVKDNLNCGKEFILNASGTATFARAHYLFAAKELAKKRKIVVTGNFGSEIFRAAHIPGIVISRNLYHLFNSPTPEKAFELIERELQFAVLDVSKFHNEWEELKNDLRLTPRFNPLYSGLTLNQKFYIMIFEEVFRKYFGAEMINQFGYIKNRTPYLDFDFLKEILKTKFAGIHSDFFESRPLKRYKGQVLYAYIIRKAFPLFGALYTDKGYKPDDLISLFGKVNIVRGYLQKGKRHDRATYDPNGVDNAWKVNHKQWESLELPADIYSAEIIDRHSGQLTREDWFKIRSIAFIYNKYLKDES